MEFDARGPLQPFTSILLGVALMGRHKHSAPKRGRHPDRPAGHPGVPKGGYPKPNQLGDRQPTRSWTQPLKVETLRVYEGHGHTLARHVDHGANADVERLQNDTQVPASGSFLDEATAQRCVDAVIAANITAIGNWLGARKSLGTFVRDLDMGEPVGSVLTRTAMNAALASGETPHPEPVTGVRLVLRRTRDFPGGFFVLTAYPMPRSSAATAMTFPVVPLQQYERDGHTLDRHVGIDAAAMAARLRDEPEISAASCFIDLDAAQQAVDTAIREHGGEIQDWLASSCRFPFSGDLVSKRTVGVALTREAFDAGRRQPTPTNRIHFLLVRSADYPGGFFVKTAYPVLAW